jgi:hypothetical protein
MGLNRGAFGITRRCKVCKVQKPIRGSTTYPKFMCADCKKLRQEENKS